MGVRIVVFDVGETLVDESRYWRDVADLAGLPVHVVTAALGFTIARGEEHTALWGHLGVEKPARLGDAVYDASDVFPDVRPCLAALRAAGYVLAAAGNQTPALEAWLRSAGLPLEVVGSSASWGARKPDSRFFEKLVETVGGTAEQTAYVGDRVDNDVVPAALAGLVAVQVRRGPWGRLQPRSPHARLVVETLTELPGALASLE